VFAVNMAERLSSGFCSAVAVTCRGYVPVVLHLHAAQPLFYRNCQALQGLTR
jgi:hypothetical protein